ncbi:ORF6C domain-containing protein [Paenibacillus sp. M2]|uniref:ORF6C domain-containing protein n=1 Tax=Paenibacillus sp. M2 TaxID=3341793 RepID=UPI003989B72A
MSEIYSVEQKLVPFNGAELLGVRANDGKVYVGVKWVCQGIGFDKNHSDAQVKKIQTDVVLGQGASNLTLPTNGGRQEALVIELDFLPLWLAKISITPSMQAHQPEVADKLVKYQLKAKDVLAAAFIHNGFNYDDLSPELKAIFAVDKKMQQLDSRLEHLENHTTIDYAQQRLLRKAGNSKVVGVLGGKKSAAYSDNSIRSSVYSALWNDYQEYFNITSYCNTYTKDLERGLQYVPHWTPPTNLLRRIEEVNGQTLF